MHDEEQKKYVLPFDSSFPAAAASLTSIPQTGSRCAAPAFLPKSPMGKECGPAYMVVLLDS